MKSYSVKVDLHVHSKASRKPAGWFTELLKCPESFTEPLILYQTLKRRRMDYVTITDHDTIDGVLEISHLPDVFLSCEYTVQFPEMDAKIHVLVFGISEGTHRDLMSLRENVYEFVRYLKQNQIAHSLAHPLYSVEGTKVTKELIERFVLLFDNWEILNGTRTDKVWKLEERIARYYDSWKTIYMLSEKYQIEPLRSRGTIGFTAGSDDHGGEDAGKTFTVMKGVKTLKDLLNAIMEGKTEVETEPLGEQRLLNTVSSIGSKYIKSRISSLRRIEFLEEVKILLQNRRLLSLVPHLLAHRASVTGNTKEILKVLSVSSLQGIVLMLKFKQVRDQKKIEALGREFGITESRQTKVAYLVDTYTHTNGVANSSRSLRELSEREGLPITFFVSSDEKIPQAENLVCLKPLGSIDVPFYPGMRVGIPNVLQLLEYIERENFSGIHIATPGPLGLMGFLIGKILNLKLSFTYHTDLPSYIRIYTGDEILENLVRGILVQIMGSCDTVFSPSNFFRSSLISWGIRSEKVEVFVRGVDTRRFSPDFREDTFWNRKLGLDEKKRVILYVGRVSKEKNLDLIMKIAPFFPEEAFVIVGDGPKMKEYQRSRPKNVYFTGYLYGTELSKAYSSSHVFLFPSETETYGLVILEALSSGLPVVVSSAGASREHITNGVEGFICGDRTEFVESLKRLLTNEYLRRSMSDAARKRAESLDFRKTHLEYLRKILRVSEELCEDSGCDHILPLEKWGHKKVS